MPNPYAKFVEELEGALSRAENLPLGGIEKCAPAERRQDAGTALIFAPHPDDECITGLLPLRLMREAGFKIVDVAVTLGSKIERREERRQELLCACAYLGWDVEFCGKDGFASVGVDTKRFEPELWESYREEIIAILKKYSPKIIFLPHKRDAQPTHNGVTKLVRDAMRRCDGLSCILVETEFWGAMTEPNLLVEAGQKEVADLCAALSFHKGEVARNPYHLNLPFWMNDNVRRGAELISGRGAEAPKFRFGTIYKVKIFRDGEFRDAARGAVAPFMAQGSDILESVKQWR